MFRISAEAKGEGSDLVNMFKLPSSLLMTVQRRYICCGSLVLHVISACIWSSTIWSFE